jgi:hypothetical protein
MVTAGRIHQRTWLGKRFHDLVYRTVMEEECDGLCWPYIIKKTHPPELVVINRTPQPQKLPWTPWDAWNANPVKGPSCHGSAPERVTMPSTKSAELHWK